MVTGKNSCTQGAGSCANTARLNAVHESKFGRSFSEMLPDTGRHISTLDVLGVETKFK